MNFYIPFNLIRGNTERLEFIYEVNNLHETASQL